MYDPHFVWTVHTHMLTLSAALTTYRPYYSKYLEGESLTQNLRTQTRLTLGVTFSGDRVVHPE